VSSFYGYIALFFCHFVRFFIFIEKIKSNGLFQENNGSYDSGRIPVIFNPGKPRPF